MTTNYDSHHDTLAPLYVTIEEDLKRTGNIAPVPYLLSCMKNMNINFDMYTDRYYKDKDQVFIDAIPQISFMLETITMAVMHLYELEGCALRVKYNDDDNNNNNAKSNNTINESNLSPNLQCLNSELKRITKELRIFLEPKKPMESFYVPDISRRVRFLVSEFLIKNYTYSVHPGVYSYFKEEILNHDLEDIVRPFYLGCNDIHALMYLDCFGDYNNVKDIALKTYLIRLILDYFFTKSLPLKSFRKYDSNYKNTSKIVNGLKKDKELFKEALIRCIHREDNLTKLLSVCYLIIELVGIENENLNSEICEMIGVAISSYLNKNEVKTHPRMKLGNCTRVYKSPEDITLNDEEIVNMILSHRNWTKGTKFISMIDKSVRKSVVRGWLTKHPLQQSNRLFMTVLQRFPTEWRNYTFLYDIHHYASCTKPDSLPNHSNLSPTFCTIPLHPKAIDASMKLNRHEFNFLIGRVTIIMSLRFKDEDTNPFWKGRMSLDLFLSIMEYVLEVPREVFMDKNSWGVLD